MNLFEFKNYLERLVELRIQEISPEELLNYGNDEEITEIIDNILRLSILYHQINGLLKY